MIAVVLSHDVGAVLFVAAPAAALFAVALLTGRRA